jgi:hypothetical protein
MKSMYAAGWALVQLMLGKLVVDALGILNRPHCCLPEHPRVFYSFCFCCHNHPALVDRSVGRKHWAVQLAKPVCQLNYDTVGAKR